MGRRRKRESLEKLKEEKRFGDNIKERIFKVKNKKEIYRKERVRNYDLEIY